MKESYFVQKVTRYVIKDYNSPLTTQFITLDIYFLYLTKLDVKIDLHFIKDIFFVNSKKIKFLENVNILIKLL